MAVFNIVKLSKLEGAKRIDPEYYQPKYFSLLNKLESCNALPIKKIALPACRKFRPQKNEFFEYIEISKVDLLTGAFDTFRIIGKDAPDRAQWIVKKNDVLVSTVRPLRNAVVLVKNEQDNLVASSGFCVLEPLNIPAEYLFIYFKTNFIRYLLDRYTTATEYPAVSWNDILNIPIYLGTTFIQKSISKLVSDAFALLKQCIFFYSQAEQLLLSELGLQDWKPAQALTYTRSYSQVSQAHRLDAEYFHPKYDELREHICKYPNGFLRITDIAIHSAETIEPRAHAESEYRYIELADINQVIGTIESTNIIKGKAAPSRARMLLHAGDVIASTVEGSLDKIALVSEEYHGAIGSTGFFVLRPRTVQSGYLLALVKSIVVRDQMRCESSGTILAAVPAKSLRNIIVPDIPPEKQDEIAQLVQQSHSARREAKVLLEKAKRAVEIAIEENEERAIEFISTP